MTTLTAYPVEIKDGVVRLADGSPLPRYAKALLIIFPDSSAFDSLSLAEWQKPFDKFLAMTDDHKPEADINELSDEELNKLVHAARKPL